MHGLIASLSCTPAIPRASSAVHLKKCYTFLTTEVQEQGRTALTNNMHAKVDTYKLLPTRVQSARARADQCRVCARARARAPPGCKSNSPHFRKSLLLHTTFPANWAHNIVLRAFGQTEHYAVPTAKAVVLPGKHRQHEKFRPAITGVLAYV